MNEEEKKAFDYLQLCYDTSTIDNESLPRLGIFLNLIDKQNKVIDEMRKELDLDNETEIALNNRIMDLEGKIDKQDKAIKEYETLLKRQEKLEQEKDILKKQGWL